MLYDIRNSKQIYNHSDAVVIVHIDTIDGTAIFSPKLKEPMSSAFTYGTATILESYKGNLEAGSTIEYMRSDGIIPFEKYYQSETEKTKELLDKNINHEKFVEFKHEDNIEGSREKHI